jgi:membrane-bound metal-dependent hydrolase YbcI (DUF457 family)
VPITPFHFGAGAAFHAVAPRRVSFLAFCLANCITDCEPVVNLLRGALPLHRFLHTFVGATLVAGATVGLFAGLRTLAARRAVPDPFEWQKLGIAAVALGAALGTFSHIVLDGIMHADVRPFAPWSEANPFYRMVSPGSLHIGCLVAGAFGVAAFFLRQTFGKSEAA